jgi:hypothetical protein
MNQLRYKHVLIFTAMIMVGTKVNGQTILPDELTKNTIKEQINYIEERTRIYEEFYRHSFSSQKQNCRVK